MEKFLIIIEKTAIIIVAVFQIKKTLIEIIEKIKWFLF